MTKINKKIKKLNRNISLSEKVQEKRSLTFSHVKRRKVIFGNSMLVLSPEISQTDVVVRISRPERVIKHSKTIKVVANILTKMPSRMINRLGYDLLE